MTAAAAAVDPSSDVAVRSLVAQASKRGYAIAYDLLRDRGEAEDAVQDALVRVIQWLPKLRDPGALEAWFYRTLANGCIRTLRRRRVAHAFARLVGARGEPATEPVGGGDHARLLAAIDDLPAMQKAALVLRHGHELSVEEVARVLDVGTETVKTHLKRARTRMRERLGVP
ncbi:MAG: sigma-70 family RNA polymerase sigma factor [Kofleriaceae bacterium]